MATPHFYITPPPFQGYPPFLAKVVTQFLEGPTPPLIKGGGGPTMDSIVPGSNKLAWPNLFAAFEDS